MLSGGKLDFLPFAVTLMNLGAQQTLQKHAYHKYEHTMGCVILQQTFLETKQNTPRGSLYFC